MNNTLKTVAASAAIAAACIANPFPSDACTRVVYNGLDDLYIVARSLDWKTPIPTDIYVYPAGLEKVSDDAPDAIKWTSKYGAAYAVSYGGGITEGMNEKGLVVNGLFCKGTVYTNEQTERHAPMSLAVFVAWILDNNATTDEAVEMLRSSKFSIKGQTFDGGTVSTLHWGITDASGKTAILEFDNGKMNIYDPGDIRAMTNDPQWPAMKAIVEYWEKVGGANMLPGTVKSPDRCVRANYFAHNVERTADPAIGVSIARSVIMPSCVPYLYAVEGEPNLSSTQWRSYSDLKNKRYYFEVVTNMGYVYVDLSKINLKAGQPVWKYEVANDPQLAGEVNKYMIKTNPFTPMY